MKGIPIINPVTSILAAVFCLHLFFACTGNTRDSAPEKNDKIPVFPVLNKPPSSFSDTLVIHTPAAVFYTPDSIQLEKIRLAYPRNVYETEVHQNYYLMFTARKVLKKFWPRIRVLDTSKQRYLLFVKANSSCTCIDLDTRGDMSGLFLFDPVKEPELADMMNIDTALKYYFSE